MSSESPFPKPPGSEGSPSKRASSLRPLAPPPGGSPGPLNPSPALFTTPPSPQPDAQPSPFSSDPAFVPRGGEQETLRREDPRSISPSSPEGNNEEEEKGPSLAEKAGRLFKGTMEGIGNHVWNNRFTVSVRVHVADAWLDMRERNLEGAQIRSQKAKEKEDLYAEQAQLIREQSAGLSGTGLNVNDYVGDIASSIDKKMKFKEERKIANLDTAKKHRELLKEKEKRNAVAEKMGAFYTSGAEKIDTAISDFEVRSGKKRFDYELVHAKDKVDELQRRLGDLESKTTDFAKKHGGVEVKGLVRMKKDLERQVERATKLRDELQARTSRIEDRTITMKNKREEILLKKEQLNRADGRQRFNVTERTGRGGDRSERRRTSTESFGSDNETKYGLGDFVAAWNQGYSSAGILHINEDDFYSSTYGKYTSVSPKKFAFLFDSYLHGLKGVRKDTDDPEYLSEVGWRDLHRNAEIGVKKFIEQKRIGRR